MIGDGSGGEAWDRAWRAGRALPLVDGHVKAVVLEGMADCLEGAGPIIGSMNGRDVQALIEARAEPALVEGTRLSTQSVLRAIGTLRALAGEPDPVGRELESRVRGPLAGRLQAWPAGVEVVSGSSEIGAQIEQWARAFHAGLATVVVAGAGRSETWITLAKFVHAVMEAHGVPSDACVVLASSSSWSPREVPAASAGVIFIEEDADPGVAIEVCEQASALARRDPERGRVRLFVQAPHDCPVLARPGLEPEVTTGMDGALASIAELDPHESATIVSRNSEAGEWFARRVRAARVGINTWPGESDWPAPSAGGAHTLLGTRWLVSPRASR